MLTPAEYAQYVVDMGFTLADFINQSNIWNTSDEYRAATILELKALESAAKGEQ